MKTLQKEINELREIAQVKNDELFQKYFIQPIYKEIESLKGSYDCDTLKDLYFTKGKKEGLNFFIKLLKGIDEDIKIKEYQVDQEN